MSLVGSLIEKRSTLANPDAWLLRAFGSVQTATGVTVTESSALRASTVFACTRILAETLASLPLNVFSRQADGAKQRADSHPNAFLLHDAPNPEMTSFEWRSFMMTSLALWGNSYNQIVMDRKQTIREIWPLRPDWMKVERDRTSGLILYRYHRPEKTERIFDADEILHIRGLSLDGLVGLSPISQAREAIGLSLATEEYGARFFGNNARPGAVLEHPGGLSLKAKDNLLKSFEDVHKGLQGAHRLGILEEGMKLHEIGVPPKDAQFLELRKFQVEDIARMFRIPLHKIGNLDRATFNNIEHLGIEFVTDTVRPWAVCIEQAMNRALFGPREGRRFFAEHNLEGLMRGDAKSRGEFYTTMVNNGSFTRNEVRAFENLNPLPGLDEPLQPLNMVPVSQASNLI